MFLLLSRTPLNCQWVFVGTFMQKLVCNIYFHECHLSLCSFIFWLSWSLSNSCSLLHPLSQRYAPDEDTQHIYDQTCRQLAAASALHPSLKMPAQGWLWWPDCPCCSAPHRRARAAPEASPQTPRDGGVGRALPEKIYWRNLLLRGFFWHQAR